MDRSIFYLNRSDFICLTFCDFLIPFFIEIMAVVIHNALRYPVLNQLITTVNFFSTEKDGKAFHPTYEEKLKLVALHKQVLLGPYNPDTCPEVGFFDVLGNDRR